MATKKTTAKSKILCVKHGAELGLSNFYVANSNTVFSGLGRIPFCKTCLYEMVKGYYESTNDMKLSIYYMCRKMDISFDSNIFEGATKNAESNAVEVFKSYMTQYNSLGKKNETQLSFDGGEHIGNHNKSQVESNNIGDDIKIDDSHDDIKMTDEDRNVKNDVVKLLEYDPFEGYSEADQKFLYNDLVSYFADEEILEDQYLISQIVQIVNNNNQIRKIDFLISKYTADTDLLIKNEGKVKSLNVIKKDIVQNNDKIAKENSISVKNRKGSSTKKSSLTVMMDYLRSLNFEDAEIDYYDQKKAYGMKVSADISMRAMSEQIQFDENDTGQIIMEQRNMIKNMEEKILDLEETNRQLYVQIEKYKKSKLDK